MCCFYARYGAIAGELYIEKFPAVDTEA